MIGTSTCHIQPVSQPQSSYEVMKILLAGGQAHPAMMFSIARPMLEIASLNYVFPIYSKRTLKP